MLKYQGYSIAFQEVPGEISLVFQIANCPRRCAGCHSPRLREDAGRPLAPDILGLITRYRGMITCVCFIGEGNDLKALKRHLCVVRAFALKTCLYSGDDEIGELGSLIPHLDYLKLGSYRQAEGGLTSVGTNQRFYAVRDGRLHDMTHQFWKARNVV